MLLEIIRRTPIWVWVLLAALLALGVRQLRERRVSMPRLFALPVALLALGLFATASAFVPAWPALVCWALALAAGSALGQRLPVPAGAQWDAAGRTLYLPGSALPLVLIVAIFTLRYASSVALVLHPQWRHAAAVAWPLAAAYGAISGLLLGRVLALRQRAAITMPRNADPRPA
jgi:hypothetical protein